jgi:DNA-binding PadR family transcriptional regulator
VPRVNKDSLTNVEAVALFFLVSGDKYGYEIEKIIKEFFMRRWIRVGLSSLYKTLERLKDKGLIEVRTERVGKMPERKIYSLTPDGKKRLTGKARKLLGEMEYFYLDFSLGLAMLGTLIPMSEVKGLFESRLGECHEYKAEVDDFQKEKESELGEGAKLVIEHLNTLYKAETRWLKKALEDMGDE